MASSQADLGALAVSRSGDGPATHDLRLPRRWFTRAVLPAGLLAGFTGLVAWAAWDLIDPPLPVKVVPVEVVTVAVTEATGSELFQANGWVEPRPRPVEVPVQTEGMYRVKEVRVNPGERVRAEQVLAVLDDEKARLELEAAQKRWAKRLAAIESARAEVDKADVAIATAAENIMLANAESLAETKLAEADITKAQAMLAASELSVQIEEDLHKSGALSSDVKMRQARQQRDVAKADLQSMKARCAKTQTAFDARVRQAERLKISAQADLKSFQAKALEAVQEAADAAVEIKKAQLELDRTRIVAPIGGRVMQLNVRVGTVVGGRTTAIEHKDAAVTLYDPTKLQVRVEVPIAKFQFVRNGQPATVEIEDLLPGKKLAGTVLYDAHLANIARNSLPVTVALPDNSPEQLRPEMIVSVRFLAPPAVAGPKTESAQRLVVPRRLLIVEGDQTRVWVVDRVRGWADLRAVELAPGEKGRQAETADVVGGLQPTDKLISTNLDQLKPGLRVRITGEAR